VSGHAHVQQPHWHGIYPRINWRSPPLSAARHDPRTVDASLGPSSMQFPSTDTHPFPWLPHNTKGKRARLAAATPVYVLLSSTESCTEAMILASYQAAGRAGLFRASEFKLHMFLNFHKPAVATRQLE